MNSEANSPDLWVVAVGGTILFLVLALLLILILSIYYKRQFEYMQEKQRLTELFEQTLLQSQIEIQNQTLQQIGRELHDNIGQLLTVVVMRLNALEDDSTQGDTQQAIQQTRDLVRTVIADIRMLSKTLDHDTVQRFGLLPSLTLELERIQRVGHIHTQLSTSGDVYSLGQQTETVLLRMAQESINNALKHANASNLTVSVGYKPSIFTLTIADDGKGFDPEEVSGRSLKQAGVGLTNLHRRTELLGGTCTIHTQLGTGTDVRIQVPRNRTR